MTNARQGSKRWALTTLLSNADAYAWRGAGAPEDIESIEEHYLRAINRMEKLLDLPLTKTLEEKKK